MLGLAFMAWLTVVICYGGNWLIGQCMCERPIVVGLVAGILMGDIPWAASWAPRLRPSSWAR